MSEDYPNLETQQQNQIDNASKEFETYANIISIDKLERARMILENLNFNSKFLDDVQAHVSNPRFKYFKQGYYYGELQNKLRHGFGLMVYETDSRLYIGNWQNDRKNGDGKEIFNNFDYYEGQYVNGKPNGYGEYCTSKGESYVGGWFDGQKNGYGEWKDVNQNEYKGEWSRGQANGQGIVKSKNSVYEGQILNFLKHGVGYEKFANGDEYEGEYINGKPDGEGEYRWSDGSIYKGEFCGGVRQGKGTWIGIDGNRYEGEYVNDKKSGYGIFKWKSGNVYQGEFFDDYRNGQGEMKWADGSFYKGQWIKGVQEGQGELYVSGIRKKGQFLRNELFKEEKRPQSQQFRTRILSMSRNKEDQFMPIIIQKPTLSYLMNSQDDHFNQTFESTTSNQESIRKVVIRSRHFNKSRINYSNNQEYDSGKIVKSQNYMEQSETPIQLKTFLLKE